MYLRAVTTDPRFLPAIQNLSRVQSR
jgi:hypothetical protein